MCVKPRHVVSYSSVAIENIFVVLKWGNLNKAGATEPTVDQRLALHLELCNISNFVDLLALWREVIALEFCSNCVGFEIGDLNFAGTTSDLAEMCNIRGQAVTQGNTEKWGIQKMEIQIFFK